MIKYWISPYTLTSVPSFLPKKKSGFLIRMQSDDFEYGYADCFPWEQFGDPRVEDLIAQLRSDVKSRLLKTSLVWARKDGEARAAKVSLLQGQDKVENHLIVANSTTLNEAEVAEALAKGFRTFKLKVGKNPQIEIQKISWFYKLFAGQIQLRLDFNGQMKAEFFPLLMQVKDFIDFIEDPYPELSDKWLEIHKLGVRTAWDQAKVTSESLTSHCQLQVVKPAKQNIKKIFHKNAVFTSYLDHPVGQACALAAALEFGADGRAHGLMSHEMYEPTRFSRAIENRGNRFIVPGELGIGFDELWNGVPWEPLTTA